MREKNTWDLKKGTHVETPKAMIEFFNEIEEVCKKHGLSIAHEDNHGAFIVESFNESNMRWLRYAQKNY